MQKQQNFNIKRYNKFFRARLTLLDTPSTLPALFNEKIIAIYPQAGCLSLNQGRIMLSRTGMLQA